VKKTIHSEKQQKLSKILTRGREDAALTQALVAKKLGKPQSFVAKYEGGERRLDVIELLKITKILGMNIHAVLDELK
jgi:transcriptional regulator with XRE-family HTH domain